MEPVVKYYIQDTISRSFSDVCSILLSDFKCGTLWDQNYAICEKGMQTCPDAPTFGPPAL